MQITSSLWDNVASWFRPKPKPEPVDWYARGVVLDCTFDEWMALSDLDRTLTMSDILKGRIPDIFSTYAYAFFTHVAGTNSIKLTAIGTVCRNNLGQLIMDPSKFTMDLREIPNA